MDIEKEGDKEARSIDRFYEWLKEKGVAVEATCRLSRKKYIDYPWYDLKGANRKRCIARYWRAYLNVTKEKIRA